MQIEWTGIVIMQLISTFFIVFCWTMMYRENNLYRIPENLLIGLASGYGLYYTVTRMWERVWTAFIWPTARYGNIAGYKQWYFYVAFILGACYILRLWPRTRWLASYPISISLGVSMGTTVFGTAGTMVIPFFTSPFIKYGTLATTSTLQLVNGIIISVVAFTTWTYFIFTYRHTGLLGASAKIGRHLVMVSFGMTMGTYLSSTTAYVIGLMFDIFHKPRLFATPFALAIILGWIIWDRYVK
jgi:hypothetical protein